MTQKILILGGIGDFLQCLPFIKANNNSGISFTVVTHLKNSDQFFENIGIKPETIILIHSDDEARNTIESLTINNSHINCPRSQYFDNAPFPPEKPLFENSKPVVGVHINGSAFSINRQQEFGMPLKELPIEVIHKLISSEYNLMVFGLKEEIENLGLVENHSLRLIMHKNPAKSLAYVQQCNVIVGSDSGIKTMSAMLKIPTFVWLADYADPGRDQMFIDPYVKDGIIELFKYSKINTQISDGISKTQAFLSRKLMKNTNTIINSDYGPIIISSNDKGVGSDIQITGYFEKDQILLICKIIEIMLSKKDRINFYDVGANIGTHTLSIAKTFGNKVKIRSFEAQRQIFYMLCGTVAINNLRNVSCHNLAIGGHNGSLDINLPDYDQVQNFGGFELLPIEKTDNSTMIKNSVEPVNIVTLDSFNEEIDFIKMDIEGMEESALIASSEMLARYKPVCFVEIFKSNETNIFKIFEELGYIGYRTHQDLFALPPGLDVTFSDLPRCF